MARLYPRMVLILLVCYAVTSQDSMDVWKPLAFLNCAPNDKQTSLLRMYFSRVALIDAIELLSAHGQTTRFAASLVKLLSINATALVRTFSITAQSPSDIFRRQYLNPVRQIFNYQLNRQRNLPRRDESSFGSIIYTDDLFSLETLILGPIQHPFDNPDGIYLIFLTLVALDENWQLVAANLLQILWYKWQIMQAIVLSTCDPEQRVGQYDPFDRDPATGLFGSVKWTDIDTIQKNNFWFLSMASNWQLYPIRATMFPRFPTLIESSNVSEIYRYSYMINVADRMGHFTGFDGVVLGNMAAVLNFSVKLVLNSDKYGININGSGFNGAIGNLLTNKADIAINSRFLTDYETNEIDFLFPMLSDKFCVIAPSAEPLPDWTAIFRCFDRYAWTLIAVIQFLSAIMWFVLRKQMPLRRGENPRFSLGNASFQMYKITISYPAIMPRSGAEMNFIASCLIVNLIIAGTFRGLLFNSLSEDAYGKEIDTLQQLDDSQLKIMTNAKSVKNIFGEANDGPLLRSLQSKVEFRMVPDHLGKLDYCIIERLTDVNIAIKSKYGEDADHPPVHIVKECPRTYHLVYIIKRGTPFRAKFNRVLTEFCESGLFTRWYNHLEIALVADKKRQNKKVVYSTHQALSLADMKTAFDILIIGLILSIFAFVGEILYFKKKQKQRINRWAHRVYIP